jgi:flavin-dependent dehydrogenase
MHFTTGSFSDVVIAGAGPAGLAFAIAAAHQGLQVTVTDARIPPIDKACGEGLLPPALAALQRLGIPSATLLTLGSPFHGIRFLHPSSLSSIEALFRRAPGLGIRRTALHQVLVDYALSLGVRIHWNTIVAGLSDTHLHTTRGEFGARWIVGADGHQSRVRGFTGLDRSTHTARRIAVRQHYSCAPWTNLVEVHWAPLAQAYVTPVSSNTICVAFVGQQKSLRPQPDLVLFPTLAACLTSATPVGKPAGAVTLSRTLHRVTHNNIALLGDASGSVDAITGHGLSLCFHQAEALVQAICANDLSLYERTHRSIARLPRLMSSAMLLLDNQPALTAPAFAALRLVPNLFSALIHLHTREPDATIRTELLSAAHSAV